MTDIVKPMVVWVLSEDQGGSCEPYHVPLAVFTTEEEAKRVRRELSRGKRGGGYKIAARPLLPVGAWELWAKAERGR